MCYKYPFVSEPFPFNSSQTDKIMNWSIYIVYLSPYKMDESDNMLINSLKDYINIPQ